MVRHRPAGRIQLAPAGRHQDGAAQAHARSRVLLLATAIALCAALPAAAYEGHPELVVPRGWFAGDLHAHWPDSACYGVSPPERMIERMPDDLNLVSVLLWNGGGFFTENVQAYFRGKEDNPVSMPNRIVHYDLELSAFLLADRFGHCSYLNLASIDFPRTGYHKPVQLWARAQDAVIGSDHSQGWVSSYDEFPTLEWCCTPYETPVAIAHGRVDYLDYQGVEAHLRRQWRFFWYSLLNCGFRPGLAATSDSWCIHDVGSYRTYARVEGELTYEKFLDAVAQGRTVAVEDWDNFIEFKVNGVEVGGQVDAVPGEPLALEARVILPADRFRYGYVEFIRNGEVYAAHPYAQFGGEFVVAEADTAGRSSWYSVRTTRSHAGAVFVEVDGLPVRPSVQAPQYYMDYMDYLSTAVQGDFFWQLTPAERESMLVDIGLAKDIYEQIRDEALSQPVAVGSVGPAPPAERLLGSWPNPFHHDLRIMFESAGFSPVTVNIFAADGRFLRRLLVGAPGSRNASVIWDGMDASGERVPSGVYYYEVEAGGRSLGAGRAVRVR